jgi:hypothetical protein
MKKIIKILSISLVFTLMLSCSEEWLDVNTDPNSPESASPELVFSAGTLELATFVGGYYNLLGGFWSNYWTQSNAANQYKYMDQYNIIITDFDREWNHMFASTLNDLRYVRIKAEEDEQWTIYLMATVLECYGFQVLADLYDQVPYFEALQGQSEGVFSANFDSGQDIYDALIIELDKALSKELDILSDKTLNQDFVFGWADAEVQPGLWIQFANTLKLKLYMRQMYARPAVAEAGVRALFNAGANFLTTDAQLDIYVDAADRDHPLYACNVRKLNVGTNLRSSASLYNYLFDDGAVNFDPRFDELCGPSPSGSGNVALPQGGFSVLSTVVDPPTVSVFVLSPTTPVQLITEAESYFLQAEAIARGWGSGDAKALYDAGVLADFAKYGLDGSAFIAGGGRYEYPGGDFETQQEAIIMAKWVSMAGTQSIEAFFETNRTHYPPYYTPVGGNYDEKYADALAQAGTIVYSLEGLTQGLFPKRLLVPQSERLTNVNTPGSILSAKVTDKVWWDTK